MSKKEYKGKWTEEYHKEYNRAYSKKHYQKNKEKCKEQVKQWRKENPDKVKAIHKKWRESNKEKVEKQHQKYKKTLSGCLATKLGHLKKQKRNRTLDFEINKDDLLELWGSQDGRCAISNYPMKYNFNSLFSVSVDRIDSSLGYIKQNIQLVCQGINFAKNHYSNEEMIEFWEYRDQIG